MKIRDQSSSIGRAASCLAVLMIGMAIAVVATLIIAAALGTAGLPGHSADGRPEIRAAETVARRSTMRLGRHGVESLRLSDVDTLPASRILGFGYQRGRNRRLRKDYEFWEDASESMVYLSSI